MYMEFWVLQTPPVPAVITTESEDRHISVRLLQHAALMAFMGMPAMLPVVITTVHMGI